MTLVSKDWSWVMLMLIIILIACMDSARGEDFRRPVDFRNKVRTHSDLNVKGALQIKGTNMTATAAQLNQLADNDMDTLTVSGAATFKNQVTAISTNLADTNVVINTSGQLVMDNVTALASNKLLVGDASGVGQAVTLSGDVLSETDGTMTIQDVSVQPNDIQLTDAYILVGSSGTGSAVAVSGNIEMSNAGLVYAATNTGTTAVSATNGASITLNAGLNVLSGEGQTATFTNTVTLANPANAGVVAYVINTGTNQIAIAKSGNWKSTAVEVNYTSGEPITAFSTDTSSWYGK